MRKKLIVSGDSCTEDDFQSPCHPETEFNFPKWPNHLADHLGMKLVNKARGGQGNEFVYHSLLEEAIQVYDKGKVLMPNQNYSIQLARIYGDQGNIEKMFENYIEYIAYRPNYINNIKRAVSDFISENKDNENNLYLRRLLLKKIKSFKQETNNRVRMVLRTF